MYKLLLVTDQAGIEAAFNAVPSWESMGFREPRITSSVNGAIASLKAHHADAIVLALPKAEESALRDHLNVFYPILPVCEAADTVGGIEERMTELRRLLNRTQRRSVHHRTRHDTRHGAHVDARQVVQTYGDTTTQQHNSHRQEVETKATLAERRERWTYL